MEANTGSDVPSSFVLDAAINLYGRMSEQVEDIQIETAAETWPGGPTEWIDGVSNGSISQEVIEKHEEETCRAILLEVGNACHRRAIGLKPFVDES